MFASLTSTLPALHRRERPCRGRVPTGGRAAGLLVLASFGAAGAWWARGRARAIADVAPDLRDASLWLPLEVLPSGLAGWMFGLGGSQVPATQPVAGVRIETREATSVDGTAVPLRLYEPARRDAGSPALLWIHGGGYVTGSAQMDDDLASALARDLGIVVVGVDYRLAPRHRFPAGFQDCWAALEWLRDEASALGIDAARIAVGGASAGGGLAAAMVQRALDEQVPVCFQLLLYAMLDDRTSLLRDHDGRGTFAWTPAFNRAGWRAWLGAATTPDLDPPDYAVPARRNDLSGLPPTWIGVGDLDLFLAEDLSYAHRMRAAGVPVEVHVQRGLHHGADGGRTSGTGAEFRRLAARALAHGLGVPFAG